jgi:FAD/FMN-containing dehydrogenase
MIGSEGTLGVITAATVKLFPRPRVRVTLFAGLTNPVQALALLNFIKSQASYALQAFELLPRIGVDFVLRHGNLARDPFSHSYPWYVLVEFAAAQDDVLHDLVVDMMGRAEGAHLLSAAVVASSMAQSADLWRLRELMSEAQRHEGGSIKHDVSVPIKDVPSFIDEADRLVTAQMPGARPVPFGHMGDGNIHYNVSQPVGMDKAAFLARWSELNDVVHGVVEKFGGSISAEHGIGRLKRDLLQRVKDPVALEMMRAIKSSLDPKGIMNPGKLL